MGGKILVFVGIILIGVGALCYYKLGQSGTGITVNGQRVNSADTRATLQYAIGGGLAGLGLLFLVGGVRMNARQRKNQKQIQHIINTGIPVEGTVTFADKNYRILINKQPVYSIVEYTYVDQTGKQHTRRVETVPSDYVIRNQIQVGTKVNVKYATEDYSKSTILL